MNKFAGIISIIGFGTLTACIDEQGPFEQAGEEIDEAVEDVRNGGETPANQIDDAIDEARDTAEDAVDEAEDAF